MLINVRVSTNAKQVQVTKIDDDSYEVRIDERASEGRANNSLLEILSNHFGVPISRITIIRGAKSRDKLIEIILEKS